jgi:nitrous oxide reductase accessory protein NosL
MNALRRVDVFGTGFLAAVLIVVALWSPARADESVQLPNGSKLNLSATCPVCGMKVGGDMAGTASYAYKDGRLVGFAGAAAAVFKDGSVVGFEGARCLFIYNTIPKRFGIDVANIFQRYVTDFNTQKFIDAKNAVLVLGSRIKGPMGHELVAFSTLPEVEKFKDEFDGKRIVDLHTVGIKDVERAKEKPAIKP